MLAKDFKCDSRTWDDLFKVSKSFKGEIKRPDKLSSWDTKELRELAKIKIAIIFSSAIQKSMTQFPSLKQKPNDLLIKR